MKSIMHDKRDGTCYLCMMLHGDHSRKELQEHHVFFGTANRKLSERYGLKVYLCRYHHTHGSSPEAVHSNAEIAELLKKEAQKAFEKKNGSLNFREIFGKNYLGEEDLKKGSP